MKTTSGFYSEAKRLAAATAKKHKTKEGQKNGKCWIQDFFFSVRSANSPIPPCCNDREAGS